MYKEIQEMFQKAKSLDIDLPVDLSTILRPRGLEGTSLSAPELPVCS